MVIDDWALGDFDDFAIDDSRLSTRVPRDYAGDVTTADLATSDRRRRLTTVLRLSLGRNFTASLNHQGGQQSEHGFFTNPQSASLTIYEFPFTNIPNPQSQNPLPPNRQSPIANQSKITNQTSKIVSVSVSVNTPRPSSWMRNHDTA